MAFLPICREDLEERGISELDFVYISGDAYVDHPSFGTAVIARIIENKGFSVGIIAQPMCDADYKKLGTPRLGFMVGSGVVDSMVNNYTAAKRRRSTDDYSEGGVAGKRPDRALNVYCQNLRRLFGKEIPIVIGGIEGSLRRFAHYDYWADRVFPSILVTTGADLLIYGMGEAPLFEILRLSEKNVPISKMKNIRGTAVLTDDISSIEAEILPSFDEISKDKIAYCKAFNLESKNTDGRNASVLVQEQSKGVYALQNLPALPLTEKEMDYVASLPYERRAHPVYKMGVPAITEIQFSINSHKGCFGGCSFCAINFHQGRAIQSRSKENIVAEAEKIASMPEFKGYIHDVGGPSANFYQPSCENQLKNGMCKNRQCIGSTPCKNLRVSHEKYLDVLRAVRQVKGVKKVFVRSGVRFDYVQMDKDPSFFNELCKYHISGQLKIAPEHVSKGVLKNMNKPDPKMYFEFAKRFEQKNKELHLKQFLVPYFISSHPCCTTEDAVELTKYLKSIGYCPEQVQDFYPTPSTKSTCEFYTGLNPDTLEPIFVAKSSKDKQIQKALLQWRKKENQEIVGRVLNSEKNKKESSYKKNDASFSHQKFDRYSKNKFGKKY
ncbi:MAG: YgiQ family radical SAM protein [Clostridia bacterium]